MKVYGGKGGMITLITLKLSTRDGWFVSWSSHFKRLGGPIVGLEALENS